jgi:predicted methyltransferase
MDQPWIAPSHAARSSNAQTVKEIPMYDQSKLSELIRFARVEAGSTVIDVYPGDGDWTSLLSDIVGPEGQVYSFVPAEVAHFKNDPVGRMRTLAKEPGRENVEAVSADLVAMPEATQPADVVLWLHLFYHDLHTALIQARGATAAHFNRAVYERLKLGGSYVIVDHAAAVGAGTSDAQSLHRIEPASAREEDRSGSRFSREIYFRIPREAAGGHRRGGKRSRSEFGAEP